MRPAGLADADDVLRDVVDLVEGHVAQDVFGLDPADALLDRGDHAVEGDRVLVEVRPERPLRARGLQRMALAAELDEDLLAVDHVARVAGALTRARTCAHRRDGEYHRGDADKGSKAPRHARLHGQPKL